MESDWQQFTKLLEEKISQRVAPLEEQLEHQQELISKLTSTLSVMLELINKKPVNSVPAGKGNNSDKVTGKTEASENDEEKPAETPLG